MKRVNEEPFCCIMDVIEPKHVHFSSIILKINNLSFGYASRNVHTIYVHFDSINNFNFQKPELPQHYKTPRAVLCGIKPEFVEVAPAMPHGYSSEALRKFHPNLDIPDNCFKLAPDYPSIITEGIRYIHPLEDRFLTKEELELLYGGPLGSIPSKILEYLHMHVEWYRNASWGDQCFAASFKDRKWKVTYTQNKSATRLFYFSEYTPPWVCPESDLYPYVKY